MRPRLQMYSSIHIRLIHPYNRFVVGFGNIFNTNPMPICKSKYLFPLTLFISQDEFKTNRHFVFVKIP